MILDIQYFGACGAEGQETENKTCLSREKDHKRMRLFTEQINGYEKITEALSCHFELSPTYTNIQRAF